MDKFEFSYNSEYDFLHTKYYGEIDTSDIEAALLEGNLRFPGVDSIVDFSEANLVSLRPQDVQSLVYLALENEPANILSAFVAPSDLEFGLARMYDAMVDGDLPQQREIFRSLKEAEAWLKGRRKALD